MQVPQHSVVWTSETLSDLDVDRLERNRALNLYVNVECPRSKDVLSEAFKDFSLPTDVRFSLDISKGVVLPAEDGRSSRKNLGVSSLTISAVTHRPSLDRLKLRLREELHFLQPFSDSEGDEEGDLVSRLPVTVRTVLLRDERSKALLAKAFKDDQSGRDTAPKLSIQTGKTFLWPADGGMNESTTSGESLMRGQHQFFWLHDRASEIPILCALTGDLHIPAGTDAPPLQLALTLHVDAFALRDLQAATAFACDPRNFDAQLAAGRQSSMKRFEVVRWMGSRDPQGGNMGDVLLVRDRTVPRPIEVAVVAREGGAEAAGLCVDGADPEFRHPAALTFRDGASGLEQAPSEDPSLFVMKRIQVQGMEQAKNVLLHYGTRQTSVQSRLNLHVFPSLSFVETELEKERQVKDPDALLPEEGLRVCIVEEALDVTLDKEIGWRRRGGPEPVFDEVEQPVFLPEKKFQEIAASLLLALNEIHEKGFLHGAVRGRNVLLAGGEASRQVKLAEMAGPWERVDRQRYPTGVCHSPADDVFALGLLLVEILTLCPLENVLPDTRKLLDSAPEEILPLLKEIIVDRGCPYSDGRLVEAVASMLCPLPWGRPSTGDLLDLAVFLPFADPCAYLVPPLRLCLHCLHPPTFPGGKDTPPPAPPHNTPGSMASLAFTAAGRGQQPGTGGRPRRRGLAVLLPEAHQIVCGDCADRISRNGGEYVWGTKSFKTYSTLMEDFRCDVMVSPVVSRIDDVFPSLEQKLASSKLITNNNANGQAGPSMFSAFGGVASLNSTAQKAKFSTVSMLLSRSPASPAKALMPISAEMRKRAGIPPPPNFKAAFLPPPPVTNRPTASVSKSESLTSEERKKNRMSSLAATQEAAPPSVDDISVSEHEDGKEEFWFSAVGGEAAAVGGGAVEPKKDGQGEEANAGQPPGLFGEFETAIPGMGLDFGGGYRDEAAVPDHILFAEEGGSRYSDKSAQKVPSAAEGNKGSKQEASNFAQSLVTDYKSKNRDYRRADGESNPKSSSSSSSGSGTLKTYSSYGRIAVPVVRPMTPGTREAAGVLPPLRYDEALAVARRLKFRDMFISASFFRGREGYFANSDALYRVALRLRQKSTLCWLGLGAALLCRGNVMGARNAFQRGYALNQKDRVTSLFGICEFFRSLGDFARLVETAKSLIRQAAVLRKREEIPQLPGAPRQVPEEQGTRRRGSVISALFDVNTLITGNSAVTTYITQRSPLDRVDLEQARSQWSPRAGDRDRGLPAAPTPHSIHTAPAEVQQRPVSRYTRVTTPGGVPALPSPELPLPFPPSEGGSPYTRSDTVRNLTSAPAGLLYILDSTSDLGAMVDGIAKKFSRNMSPLGSPRSVDGLGDPVMTMKAATVVKECLSAVETRERERQRSDNAMMEVSPEDLWRAARRCHTRNYYKMAIGVDVEDAETLCGLGEFYRLIGDTDGLPNGSIQQLACAHNYLRQALNIDPEHCFALERLSRVQDLVPPPTPPEASNSSSSEASDLLSDNAVDEKDKTGKSSGIGGAFGLGWDLAVDADPPEEGAESHSDERPTVKSPAARSVNSPLTAPVGTPGPVSPSTVATGTPATRNFKDSERVQTRQADFGIVQEGEKGFVHSSGGAGVFASSQL